MPYPARRDDDFGVPVIGVTLVTAYLLIALATTGASIVAALLAVLD